MFSIAVMAGTGSYEKGTIALSTGETLEVYIYFNYDEPLEFQVKFVYVNEEVAKLYSEGENG